MSQHKARDRMLRLLLLVAGREDLEPCDGYAPCDCGSGGDGHCYCGLDKEEHEDRPA